MTAGLLGEGSPVLEPGFLDCGAWGTFTGNAAETHIQSYADFVLREHKRFRAIAVPDVIGDAAATEERTLEFYELVKHDPDVVRKLYGVYHLNSANVDLVDGVLEYCDRLGFGGVCVGGMVGQRIPMQEKFLVLESVYSKLDRKRFKTHLFGWVGAEIVRAFLPDSIDTATHMAAGRKMMLSRFDDATGRFYTLDLRKDKGMKCETDVRLALVENLISEIVTIPDVFADVDRFGDREYMVNALEKNSDAWNVIISIMVNIVKFERSIQRIHPGFRNYMGGSFSFITGSNLHPFILGLFRALYRERILLSYAELAGLPTGRLQQYLSYLGESA